MKPPKRRSAFLRVLTVTGIALLAALAGGGCGLLSRADPAVRAPSGQVTGPTLVVLDAGAEPRRVLRYRLPVGSRFEAEMTLDLHLTQVHEFSDATGRTTTSPGTASEALVVDPPLTWQRVTFQVVEVRDGRYQVEFEVTDAGVDATGTTLGDEVVQKLETQLELVVGTSGRATMSQQGALSDVTIIPSPNRSAVGSTEPATSLEDTITRTVPLLPDVAVGRGARWRTVNRSSLAGTHLRQTTTYEITGLEGAQILYRADVSQEADEQLFGDAQANGVKLLAADIRGTSNGQLSLTDLRSTAQTTLTGSQLVETAGADPRRLRQQISIEVGVGPAGDRPTE